MAGLRAIARDNLSDDRVLVGSEELAGRIGYDPEIGYLMLESATFDKIEAEPVRVLLVEDDEVDAEAIRRRLANSRESKFEIERAGSLKQAQAMLIEREFDAVLLDLGLPDSRGMETLKQACIHARDVPFIILTGLSDGELSSASLQHGAQDYLAKNEVEIVERAVRYAIQRKRNEVEQRRMEQRLLEGQKLESLGLLAGGVAHDFNNILTSILGHATLGQMDTTAGSQLSESLRHIETASRRAGELCAQLLAYSGRGRFVVGMIDLSALVKEMAGILRMSISKKADLVLDLSENVAEIEAADAQIRQVVMNLITNASDALQGAEGTITVRTRLERCDSNRFASTYLGEPLPAGDYVVVEVSDSGVGMDERTRAQMFHPFFTTKDSGQGLGLSAVLGIVRSHRAAIEVDSGEASGTTIRVLFPATEKKVEAVRSAPKAMTPLDVDGLVLVVDDEPSIRRLAKITLERMDVGVLLASDGVEALETIARHSKEISLVLLDLTMPRLGGDEIYPELVERCPDTPIILMSGYSKQDAIAQVGDPNLAGFLQKPFTSPELMEHCRKALSR